MSTANPTSTVVFFGRPPALILGALGPDQA
jgi:hypothetical protein